MSFAESLPFLMFLVLFLGILSGFPVAFTLSGVAIIFGLAGYCLDLFHFSDFSLIPSKIYGSIINNSILMAVPLFSFMGVMLEKTGIARDLLEASGQLLRKTKGGLFYSILIVGTILAATTGIVGATVVAMSVIALPTMLANQYDKKLSCGIIAASGTLGQIIPPSIVLVLLGDIMQIDVATLFKSAIIPGLLLVSLYAMYIFIRTAKNKNLSNFQSNEVKEPIDFFHISKCLLPSFILILIVLGSILNGWATPTEASAVGALGAILIATFNKQISYAKIYDASSDSVKITSMVFAILIGAQFFSTVFRGLDGDYMIEEYIKNMELNKETLVFLVMLMMFLLGFFLDFLEICFIVIPIVLPILNAYQMDITWLAILIALNLQCSFLTPPFGFALFYLKGTAPKEVETKHIYQGVWPFICIQLITILMVYLFPKIVHFLPSVW